MRDLSNLNISASLASTGKRGGTSYTKAEKSTAQQVILGLLIAAGHVDGDHEKVNDISEEVVVAIGETVEENAGNDLGIPNLARRAYNKVASVHFEEDGSPVDSDNWPKKRDYTSIGLIFRGALKDLKVVDQATVDTMFPTYYKNKKKSA